MGEIIRWLVICLLLPLAAYSQSKKHDSLWQPLMYFTGSWKGTGTGEPGKGVYERSYAFVLNKQFIEVRNRSVYAASNKHKDEVHEDIGYISYDKMAKTFVLRQFHAEGFVNHYKLDTLSPDGKLIVFISENIENLPKGWRAKETYILNSTGEFTEIFELAEPGKGFVLYSKAILAKCN